MEKHFALHSSLKTKFHQQHSAEFKNIFRYFISVCRTIFLNINIEEYKSDHNSVHLDGRQRIRSK